MGYLVRPKKDVECYTCGKTITNDSFVHVTRNKKLHRHRHIACALRVGLIDRVKDEVEKYNLKHKSFHIDIRRLDL